MIRARKRGKAKEEEKKGGSFLAGEALKGVICVILLEAQSKIVLFFLCICEREWRPTIERKEWKSFSKLFGFVTVSDGETKTRGIKGKKKKKEKEKKRKEKERSFAIKSKPLLVTSLLNILKSSTHGHLFSC